MVRVCEDSEEWEGGGVGGELVAVAGMAARMDEASSHEIANHLFQIVFRDLLAGSYFSAARHARRMIGEIDHRTQCVLDLSRYLHQAHLFSVSTRELPRLGLRESSRRI